MKKQARSVKTKTAKTTRRRSPLRRIPAMTREEKQPTVLERIAQVTEELQKLRSRLANAGDDIPSVGTHRLAALEAELERLWELRRREQAAPLREAQLTEEEARELAYPTPSRARG
ncbi:MAG: DUF2630 family protein [Verrucomicrobiae bacterium]|nr:DUF2630 family protein [Verrucomicrobiae bacterium]MDW8342996.1 hypothetical protein [Verrucomicrobiae bacterium]